MLEIVPLPETGHTGHAVVCAAGTVVVDPPLTTAITLQAVGGLPAVVGVIDTELATWRVSGARLVASHLGVPHWVVGVADVAGANPLDSERIADFAVEEVEGQAIATINGQAVLVGSRDRHGPSEVLAALAARWPEGRFVGSAGVVDAAGLTGSPVAPPSPLNREAVVLTNRGEADMHWADPRFGAEVNSVTAEYLTQRAGSPWAPTVIQLGGDAHEGITAIAPERLASMVPSLIGHRELVITAGDPALARQAAGFLARIGLAPVSWLET